MGTALSQGHIAADAAFSSAGLLLPYIRKLDSIRVLTCMTIAVCKSLPAPFRGF